MPQSNPVGLISSVPIESTMLLSRLSGRRDIDGHLSIGMLGRSSVVHIESGIGCTNAAHAATVLLRDHPPRLVIVFGIGGAYPGSGAFIGDVALAEKEVYADLGVITKEGLSGAEAIGIPVLRKGNRRYFNEFPMDKRLLQKAQKASGRELIRGVFLTVTQSTGLSSRAEALRRRYNALCENMEGAAVAHVCALYGVPMIELRGISNIVEDRDRRKWKIKQAALRCQETVLEVIQAL